MSASSSHPISLNRFNSAYLVCSRHTLKGITIINSFILLSTVCTKDYDSNDAPHIADLKTTHKARRS